MWNELSGQSEASMVLEVSLQPHTDSSRAPSSTAERLAFMIVRGIFSNEDVRTVEIWSRAVGLSSGSLRELCAVVGIPPRDARDLTRLLRAISFASSVGCRWHAALNVADRRTLERLSARAGLPLNGTGTVPTVVEFVRSQRFVPANELTRSLLRLLA